VTGRAVPPAPDEGLYVRGAACFVTLKKHGELRGCIGTLEPAESSLGEEIARNAYSSALRDPRFPPVHEDELDALTVSVDVLAPSESCTVDELDPVRYGVIVRAGFRRGVLLPALEGVDTVAAQVGIALQKAGIPADEPFEVERFTVTRYREGDAVSTAEPHEGPDRIDG
jgi:AmmeMemoRadiSam system protein A